MKVISVANLKGGCAKTTTSHSIATLLHKQGYKVLAIDIDAQGSLTYLSIGALPIDASIADLMNGTKDINSIIIKREDKFDIIPATLELSIAEIHVITRYAREYILKTAIGKLTESYDYIIIDCPPSASVMTINALVASTDLLIPCECELLSIDGLELFFNMLDYFKDLIPDLNLMGVIPTKLDYRRQMSKKAFDFLKDNYKCTNPIHINSKLAEIGSEKSIFEVDKNSKGAKDYKMLVEYIEKN